MSQEDSFSPSWIPTKHACAEWVRTPRLDLAHGANTEDKKARRNPRFVLSLLCIMRVNIALERRIP